jgi:hypothetical protein
MKTGYREMLRDRCPKIVNYALKWQKAKEKWVDHTYSYFVRIIGDEIDGTKIIHKATENKKAVVRIILGIVKGKPKNFKFDNTLDWDNLTDEEKAYWKRVSTWVKWFCTNYAYIENAYDISKSTGKDDDEMRVEIISKFLMDFMPANNASDEEKEAQYQYIDKLVDFLIGCFEGKY